MTDIAYVDASTLGWSQDISDLVWDTDPALFGFLFRHSPAMWADLFLWEWDKPFGLHGANTTLLAMQGDRPVGLLNAFAGASVEARAEASHIRYRQRLKDEDWAHLQRTLGLMGWLFPMLPADCWFVYNICVAPDCRGHGIGRRLIDLAAGQARAAAARSIHLDTATDRPAVAFYRKIGFEALIETRLCRLRDGEAVPSHYRMVLEL